MRFAVRSTKRRFLLPILILQLFIICFLAGEEGIILSGNLDQEAVGKAQRELAAVSASHPKRMVITVNSASGDLKEVLAFSRQIYSLRENGQTEIIVYIQDSALGPAAMVPLLADKLYISPFVSWGDIPLGTDDAIPANILRNTVISLIPPAHRNFDLLTLIASAMSDPKVVIVNDGGWRAGSEKGQEVIKPAGETLVLNHQQLSRLGLVQKVMQKVDFFKEFGLKEKSSSAGEVFQEPLQKTSLETKLSKHIKFNPQGKNTIGLLQVNDRSSQISQATWIYVKSALEYYKKSKPAFVILELNTPGGEVFAAQKISDALKELDTQYDIPVVAFINNWAISAGAMLAYSCRFISVVKDASMGAAEPVYQGEGGQLVAASEKVNSALRADFANRAVFFDRNPSIAEAMVDKDIILVERAGQIIKLDKEDQIKKTDLLISPKGKLLTLNAEQLMKFGVADIYLPPEKIAQITEGERDSGKWPASKMLLFQQPFFKTIPEATIDCYQMDWKTLFLSIISSPIVSSLLFLGMFLGFYVEINTPGFGVAGTIALLCLLLIVFSSFAQEIGTYLEVLLLLAGIAFIAIDLFFIPTFGLLGVIGIALFVIGLFGLMLPGIGSVEFEFDTKTFNAAGEAFVKRLGWLSAALVAGVFLVALLGRYVLPGFKGFSRFVLSGHEEVAENGYIAGADPKKLPKIGSKGEVVATLRPSGKVMIGDQIFDAIAYGTFIEKGTAIQVERLEGSVIVVSEEEKE